MDDDGCAESVIRLNWPAPLVSAPSIRSPVSPAGLKNETLGRIVVTVGAVPAGGTGNGVDCSVPSGADGS